MRTSDSSVKVWAFSMLAAGTTYPTIATFLLGIGVIRFSATAVYSAIAPGRFRSLKILQQTVTGCESNEMSPEGFRL
jgi:hypothetical protein